MPPPSSEVLSKGTATTRTFRFSIYLIRSFVLRTDNDDTRFEAKRVATERMSLLGGRFDDLPVFDGRRQVAFLQSLHEAHAQPLLDDGEHANRDAATPASTATRWTR